LWLGMLWLLGVTELGSICLTLAAGPLVRRLGSARRALWPYLEIAVPTCLLLGTTFGALFAMYVQLFRPQVWHVLVVLLSALTIVGILRRWHWSLRLALHVGWAFALTMEGINKLSG